MNCQNDGKIKAKINEIGNPWQTLTMKTEILENPNLHHRNGDAN